MRFNNGISGVEMSGYSTCGIEDISGCELLASVMLVELQVVERPKVEYEERPWIGVITVDHVACSYPNSVGEKAKGGNVGGSSFPFPFHESRTESGCVKSPS